MKQIRTKVQGEAILQDRIIKYLRAREWFVKSTHGNIYQPGFPDLYCAHGRYGQRWIEIKILSHGRLTPAQIETFTALANVKIGVWILVDATQEEYLKLWKPPNWWEFLDIWKGRGAGAS